MCVCVYGYTYTFYCLFLSRTLIQHLPREEMKVGQIGKIGYLFNIDYYKILWLISMIIIYFKEYQSRTLVNFQALFSVAKSRGNDYWNFAMESFSSSFT